MFQATRGSFASLFREHSLRSDGAFSLIRLFELPFFVVYVWNILKFFISLYGCIAT